MNFYSKFLDIHMREKGLTCHDYYGFKHSSDILSIRFKHTRILHIFGLLKKYLKILYTKANFQAFVFL